MIYTVLLTDSFLKDVQKLRDKEIEKQIFDKLKELVENPDKNKRLRYDLQEYYRLRVGKLRVLYTVEGNKITVEVLVRGHKYEDV